MTIPGRAVSVWFGSQKNDARFLEAWRSAPLTYQTDQPIEKSGIPLPAHFHSRPYTS